MNDEFESLDIDDEQAVAYLRNYISQDLKDKVSDEDLYFFLDTISEYYCDHGVFDQEPDADGCIDVEVDPIADWLVAEAKRCGIGEFDHDEMLQIVNGELEFGEQVGPND